MTGLQPGTAYSYRLGGAGRYVYGRTDVRNVIDRLTIVNLNDAQMKDPTKVSTWENSLAASVRAVGGAANVDFCLNHRSVTVMSDQPPLKLRLGNLENRS